MAVPRQSTTEQPWNLEVWASTTTQAQLDKLQRELEKVKDTGEKKLIREQILSLRRELNRAKQFTSITENKLVEWKNNLDSISAANLMRLDKEVSKEKRWEFLSKSFLYKRTTDTDGNTFEEPVDRDTIREGDVLFVDFWKNQSANNKIWAGHMLLSSINAVKIVTTVNGKQFEQYWIRDTRNNLTGYYSTNWRYIPVFTGDMIVIPKKYEIEKIDGFKDVSVFETSPEKIQKRNNDEALALEKFIGEIEWLERIEKWFWISTLLIREAWSIPNYRERLIQSIHIGEKYISEGHEKYAKEDLEIAVKRLKKSLELIGERNINLNFEAYKSAIAMFESGAKSYHARNDDNPRSQSVDPEKRAYGKYQFIPLTLRWYSWLLSNYWISLGRPPSEEQLQSWLNNPDAQEAVMDQYIIDMTANHILTDPTLSSEIWIDPSKLSYYLALSHIWWPGALKNPDRTDYFWTRSWYYAGITWERYKSFA